MLAPWKENYDQPRLHIRKQRHYFDNKGLSSQNYGFSRSHVWLWELDCKESWVLKNWCFWTVVLEKTLESPLDSKEFQSVHLKRNQSWIFTRKTDTEAETPILCPSEVSQSYPTLCDPMDCSPPGFLVHGTFQARILEWIAIFFSRESSSPRNGTCTSYLADWTTWEAPSPQQIKVLLFGTFWNLFWIQENHRG